MSRINEAIDGIRDTLNMYDLNHKLTVYDLLSILNYEREPEEENVMDEIFKGDKNYEYMKKHCTEEEKKEFCRSEGVSFQECYDWGVEIGKSKAQEEIKDKLKPLIDKTKETWFYECLNGDEYRLCHAVINILRNFGIEV